ncbi:uncharacterized protein LOC111260525 [Varroa jacobsoni]|uniref:Uncharacterized protein n=1 Tax=Varroa destructor TaxID=109461 RepID=A0A7M7JF83_VARDE|nr:uncharacterized protein LOC111246210 isoform X2 [Varroa destructor]XP_022689090.1 uncharacterized protein LOC111260525 [Varroa jacobsoni]
MFRQEAYAVTDDRSAKLRSSPDYWKFRLQLSLVTTILILHLFVGVTILYEVWQATSANHRRPTGGAVLGSIDVLVFLAFLARLFVRQGLYQRYIFRLGLVWCSCSVHLCALVIVLIYTITKDGWDKFEQQMLHTATKRDIAATTIVILSGFTMLLGFSAVVGYMCQRKEINDFKPNKSVRTSPVLKTQSYKTPYPYANFRLHELQKIGSTSAYSPYEDIVKPIGSCGGKALGLISPAPSHEFVHTIGQYHQTIPSADRSRSLRPLKCSASNYAKSPLARSVIQELKDTITQSEYDIEYSKMSFADASLGPPEI